MWSLPIHCVSLNMICIITTKKKILRCCRRTLAQFNQPNAKLQHLINSSFPHTQFWATKSHRDYSVWSCNSLSNSAPAYQMPSTSEFAQLFLLELFGSCLCRNPCTFSYSPIDATSQVTSHNLHLRPLLSRALKNVSLDLSTHIWL